MNSQELNNQLYTIRIACDHFQFSIKMLLNLDDEWSFELCKHLGIWTLIYKYPLHNEWICFLKSVISVGRMTFTCANCKFVVISCLEITWLETSIRLKLQKNFSFEYSRFQVFNQIEQAQRISQQASRSIFASFNTSHKQKNNTDCIN